MIKHALFCCYFKMHNTIECVFRSYHPKSGLDLLKVQNISQNQAWQRTGRAGREAAGVCYRLYTEPQFQGWPMNTVPDIQR